MNGFFVPRRSLEPWQARMSQRQQRMQRQSAAGPWDGDVDTYSDIEEEVLLLQTDDPLDKQQQPGQQGESQHRNALTTAADGSTAAPSPSAASGGGGTLEGNVATGKGGSATAAAESDAADPGPRSSAGVAGAASSSGGGEGTAAAKGETPAAEALEAVRTADAAATAGSGPATACGGDAAREQLEALEATCSAVAQEDMEAQGAIACLAGRTAKYYLRSTAVTLGRITESKGDVDVDLAPEEPPVKGPGSSAPAAPTGGGDQQGPGQVQQQQQQAPAGTSSGGAEPASGTQSASSGCRGHVVSRRQAIIRLGPDGQFRLVNMGRQVVTVNDIAVRRGRRVHDRNFLARAGATKSFCMRCLSDAIARMTSSWFRGMEICFIMCTFGGRVLCWTLCDKCKQEQGFAVEISEEFNRLSKTVSYEGEFCCSVPCGCEVGAVHRGGHVAKEELGMTRMILNGLHSRVELLD
ncbi:hypothetical protein VOLCADRAFT_90205 [Volvox carteri f. nagariensis]|uniref:FHA domain-containing protein n=1 Tax=Volvox carteri f. nagariensis TaxID=3068 RepID=D8TTS1_VOLCA|nr:uncharacterized protein VOLCADRAFT_90205 [Volvox carteri f. nagariensis]EFJ49244.1 hypothetical protein VOLCADRAFT_90205 [Volvox carteri f. nagariensis]|eukprot:XP_002949692.1 hypothetical protein VOLCADRAFT_90205 [Volvox carteri f. nagariensis]